MIQDTQSADTLVDSVTLFHFGTLVMDQSMMTYRRGLGTQVNIPVTGAFLEMRDGEHILFDTGMLPHGCDDGKHVTMAQYRGLIVRYEPQDDIRARLAEIGRTPDDIKIVINSHFHWDHAGGNRLFPKARFVVQSSEYRFAYSPDAFVSRPYARAYFDCGIDYELMQGDTVIKPGVGALTTPGHTPGHQSLLIRLPSGRTMIMTGDALLCPANLDPALPPGNAHTTEHAVASIARLKMLAELLNGDLVICHDPDFWTKWKPAPHRYR